MADWKYEIPFCYQCGDWHQPSAAHTREYRTSDSANSGTYDFRYGKRSQYRPPPTRTRDDVREEAALKLLGLSLTATRDAIRRAYREKMKAAHPDHGGDVELAKRVNAAMDELRRRRRV